MSHVITYIKSSVTFIFIGYTTWIHDRVMRNSVVAITWELIIQTKLIIHCKKRKKLKASKLTKFDPKFNSNTMNIQKNLIFVFVILLTYSSDFLNLRLYHKIS